VYYWLHRCIYCQESQYWIYYVIRLSVMNCDYVYIHRIVILYWIYGLQINWIELNSSWQTMLERLDRHLGSPRFDSLACVVLAVHGIFLRWRLFDRQEWIFWLAHESCLHDPLQQIGSSLSPSSPFQNIAKSGCFSWQSLLYIYTISIVPKHNMLLSGHLVNL
jgi:hypothetical protein